MREEIEEIVRRHARGREFLLGFSNLYGHVEGAFSHLIYGITIALRLDDGILDEVAGNRGPTRRYLSHYRETNKTLDEVAPAVAEFLRAKGARAEAIPASRFRRTGDPADVSVERLAESFPHKTAATRSGLGWIGKTALFVSDRFGPRVRLATVLTDHPLETGNPCEVSLCGDCQDCIEACPAEAASGTDWFPGLERDEFFDAVKCRAMCVEMGEFAFGQGGAPLCGICVAVCPVGIEYRTDASQDEWI